MRRAARGTTILKKNLRLKFFAFVGLIWLALLACRVTDLIAQGGATVTLTATRPRPTFTLSAHLIEIPTDTPPPPPPPSSTRPPPPTPRPATRAPTPRPVTAAPPPPTPDPDAGFYYKRRNFQCVSAPNTRIEGTITENGAPKNGVRVRISFSENGPAEIMPDFITGVDPADPNHVCPECRGKYRLSPSEGSKVDGNWWVHVVDDAGTLLSRSTFIHTQDGPGCNTATIDFVH